LIETPPFVRDKSLMLGLPDPFLPPPTHFKEGKGQRWLTWVTPPYTEFGEKEFCIAQHAAINSQAQFSVQMFYSTVTIERTVYT